MEIVQSKNVRSILGESAGRRKRLVYRLALALFYSGLMVAVGAAMHRNAFFADSVTPYLRSSGQLTSNWLSSLAARPPQLKLDMTWESHQRLAYDREKALELGAIFVDDSSFVPATVTTHNGDRTRVKVRLKGDGVNHLLGDKWSFRIHARGGDTLFGLKQFSVHHPRTRNWMFEWLGLQAMRREGVIAPRYDFVDVSINGKSLGIYALEEHFEKRLIEHNARREGPIIRFDEELMWREIVQQVRPFRQSQTNGTGEYLVSMIDGFQTDKTLANDELRPQYLHGVHLLGLFREGKLATSSAFDVERLATYFALIDLFGAEHGARWNNIRFYYNPVTTRLEPIAFDLQGGKAITALSLNGQGAFGNRGELVDRYDRLNETLFHDVEFCAAYLRELQRVSDPKYLDDLLAETQTERDRALSVLYTEFPYYEFSTDVLYRNQRYIRSVLEPAKGLHAYQLKLEGRHLELQVGNIQYLPLVVMGIELASVDPAITGLAGIDLPEPTILDPRRRDRPMELETVRIDLPESVDPQTLPSYELRVRYKVLGSDQVRTAVVARHAYTPEFYLADQQARQTPNLDQFDFLAVDEGSKKILVQPGHWQLEHDLVIPAGYTVECGPGTEFDLLDSAMILSYSPLNLLGNEEQPVVIRSTDGTGQGLCVLQAGDTSTLDHVVFDGLANPNRSGWTLTGAVTFYESDVVCSSVVFRASACEDSLNTIRCDFSLDECRFERAGGDAFDADFCEGTITGCVFVDPANDAMDVSGSTVKVSHNVAEGCGDKGVSVGEASTVEIDDLEVRASNIGIASKDASVALVNNATLKDCKYGLAIFQKKSEFGAARLEAFGLTMQPADVPLLIEHGSTLVVDGAPQESNSTAVSDMLYGVTDDAAGN